MANKGCCVIENMAYFHTDAISSIYFLHMMYSEAYLH